MKKLIFTGLALTMSCFAGPGPQPAQSVHDELRNASEELSALLEKYTERHPAVLAKRQQISKLTEGNRQQVASAASPRTVGAEQADNYKKALAELNTLLERYTDQHPRVQQKRAEIAELEKALESE